MSRALITESYLTGIANAIRTKLGVQDTYTPPQMAAAIESIPTGGITPTGTKNITQNGTHDVAQYASANVNVQPNLQSKTATQNGTVTPDQGYDGLSSVVVNVSGGGDAEPELPSEYQRVEYLDFTPTIGIYVTLPTTGKILFECDFSSDINNSNESVAFGYRESASDAKDFEIRVVSGKASTFLRTPNADNGLTLTDESYTVGSRIIGKILLVNPRATAFIGKYANYSSAGVDSSGLDGKFYSLKGTDVLTDAIVAWFVPCYRKSDNIVGVYDHIAQAFYSDTYAVGSGYSIVAGPDMN